jgi:hypothetical protein
VLLLAAALALSGCFGAGKPALDADDVTPSASASATTGPAGTKAPSAPPSGSASGTTSKPPAGSPPPSNGTGDPGGTGEPGAGGDGNATGNGTREPRPFEPAEPSGDCGSLGSLTPVAPDPLLAPGLALGWPLLRLDIALLADPTFVAAHPGDWQSLLLDLAADASVHYEAQLGLTLNVTVLDRLPDGSLAPGTGDGRQRATARGFMHANHPDADADAVALILGADYEGTTAGQVECVHGAAYPDYGYLWTEYDSERGTGTPVSGGIGFFEDIPLKTFMHELAHLLAAHHHYGTCGRTVRSEDLLAQCDVMINDIGLASYEFGPTNRLVVRSFVEQTGIGAPA